MERKGRPVGTKEKGIAGSACDETRLRIGGVEIRLSLVGLEPEGKPREQGDSLRPQFRRGAGRIEVDGNRGLGIACGETPGVECGAEKARGDGEQCQRGSQNMNTFSCKCSHPTAIYVHALLRCLQVNASR